VSGPRLWYPGCRAILQVVLDDFGAIGAASPSNDEDDENEPEVGSAGHPLVIPVLPKTVTIHKNSYRQADSYELTFDAGDLPFDPRIIRAGEAEIFLFQTNTLNGAGTVLSRKDPLSDPDPRAQAQREPMDTLALDLAQRAAKDRFTYTNKPNIAGLWDRSDLDLSSDGKWVTINGQDYTGMLAAAAVEAEPRRHRAPHSDWQTRRPLARRRARRSGSERKTRDRGARSGPGDVAHRRSERSTRLGAWHPGRAEDELLGRHLQRDDARRLDRLR
jgi:hypothetical protein